MSSSCLRYLKSGKYWNHYSISPLIDRIKRKIIDLLRLYQLFPPWTCFGFRFLPGRTQIILWVKINICVPMIPHKTLTLCHGMCVGWEEFLHSYKFVKLCILFTLLLNVLHILMYFRTLRNPTVKMCVCVFIQSDPQIQFPYIFPGSTQKAEATQWFKQENFNIKHYLL